MSASSASRSSARYGGRSMRTRTVSRYSGNPSGPLPSRSQPEENLTSVGVSLMSAPFGERGKRRPCPRTRSPSYRSGAARGQPALHRAVREGQGSHEREMLGHGIHVGALIREIEGLEIAARVDLELHVLGVEVVRACNT